MSSIKIITRKKVREDPSLSHQPLVTLLQDLVHEIFET